MGYAGAGSRGVIERFLRSRLARAPAGLLLIRLRAGLLRSLPNRRSHGPSSVRRCGQRDAFRPPSRTRTAGHRRRVWVLDDWTASRRQVVQTCSIPSTRAPGLWSPRTRGPIRPRWPRSATHSRREPECSARRRCAHYRDDHSTPGPSSTRGPPDRARTCARSVRIASQTQCPRSHAPVSFDPGGQSDRCPAVRPAWFPSSTPRVNPSARTYECRPPPAGDREAACHRRRRWPTAGSRRVPGARTVAELSMPVAAPAHGLPGGVDPTDMGRPRVERPKSPAPC